VHPLARRPGELADHCGRDGLLARAFQHGLRPLRINVCLIAGRLEAGDALLQRRLV
jgi:hypothetical protein